MMTAQSSMQIRFIHVEKIARQAGYTSAQVAFAWIPSQFNSSKIGLGARM
jgi:hypothetical protein